MDIFQTLIDAWASRDVAQFANLFAPAATWIVDGRAYKGHPAIAACAQGVLVDAAQVRVVLRRSFCDRDEADWSVAEWAFRVQTGAGCKEVEQAVIARMQADKIVFLRTHNDSFRGCQTALDAPLRMEHRKPTYPAPLQTMSRDDILKLQHRHVMQGWRLGHADNICRCHAPDSVILNAWEVVRGHEEFCTSAAQYMANFADTQIEVHRIIYDGQNIALNQTWRCTNRSTGIRAGDQDLIIGVMQDHQIHYWREYFDPNQSAQTLQQTHFGKLQAQAS